MERICLKNEQHNVTLHIIQNISWIFYILSHHTLCDVEIIAFSNFMMASSSPGIKLKVANRFYEIKDVLFKTNHVILCEKQIQPREKFKSVIFLKSVISFAQKLHLQSVRERT